ncbi:SDR family NAD(P)-dependent oxidoreductase [Streptomyces sp. 8L]|uniref:SDR family NAD(P)-dependent oxidoreductase n=1 Tax=Streptomyces sp. 8L TaxID=2877242 RepID=UPI001CD5B62D|nr:SDR family oxidoreductase [Streptomyces sp. 8L]MCA1219627.1 SDR family oxidoreductase [Streptomyces sp. 8L]
MFGVGSADTGKVALVTGAARGIGRQISITLAKHGYHLGLVDKLSADLSVTAENIERMGGEVVSVTGDVSNPENVEHCCDTVEKRFGHVDVLVNNAGYAGRFGPFAETDPDDWWEVMTTNVRGPMLFCRRMVPAMLERGHGYVVNINTRVAVRDDSVATFSGLAASKAALARFTGALAHETAGRGVVVLDINPGMVRTAMTEQRPDYDDIPDTAFLPVTVGAKMVAALVSGRYDVLHGRFIHARDDLDALAEAVAKDPRARVLGFGATGPGDPVA